MSMEEAVVLDALEQAMQQGEDPSYRADGGLSMSALGGCRRQGAYLWAQHPKEEEDDDGMRHAEMGTLLHAVILPRLALLLDGAYEVETVLERDDRAIPGTIDLLLDGAVLDLKTVGKSSFDFIRAPKVKWRAQVTAGALATGNDYCMVLVLDRDTGRSQIFAWDVLDYLDELDDWLDDACRPVDEVERDFRGPGIAKECDWGPFVSTCWPGVEGAAPQAILVKDDEGTRDMLRLYLDAREVEKQAKADMAFARSCLSGSEPAQYGEFLLQWRRSQGRESLDIDEAKRILEDAGLPIPLKVGQPSTSISVRKA